MNSMYLGWAKLPREHLSSETEGVSTSDAGFHRIIYHLLDTGACALALLRRENTLLTRLGIDSETTESSFPLLAFLVASHDIGKMHVNFLSSCGERRFPASCLKEFQMYDPYLAQNLQGKLKTGSHMGDGECHGYVSTKTLFSLLRAHGVAETFFEDGSHPLLHFFISIGFHHDKRHWNAVGFDETNPFEPQVFENPWKEWNELRLRILSAVWRELVPNGDTSPLALCTLFGNGSHCQKESSRRSVLFAGFVSTCDWIASTASFFPLQEKVTPLDEYFRVACKQAEDVIEKLRWRSSSLSIFQGLTFRELFPFSPRPLQEILAKNTRERKEPFLAVIEAPMGVGKTEAALSVLASTACALGRGCYFALPTQATSNSLFRRMKVFLETRLPGSQLQLMHANHVWNRDFEEMIRNPEILVPVQVMHDQMEDNCDNEGGDKHSKVTASEWCATSRTGLLSEFAVGTVDQVLRAVLLFQKQYFVKIFALSGKTVIIDEVHAYDAYMLTLLESLLGWLSELGSSVVLISATLPSQTRDALCRAYAKCSVEAVTFPRVTLVSLGSERSECLSVRSGSELEKKTRFDLIGFEELEDVTSRLQCDLVGKDGVIGVVCNTVRVTQRISELLASWAEAEGWELVLFHARFPMQLRQQRESLIVDRLSKDLSQRPRKILVLATQVIEQSLDIDFDRLYSFLCPIDLILQRAGRLWRRVYWDIECLEGFSESWRFPHLTVFHGKKAGTEILSCEICRSNMVYDEALLLQTLRWFQTKVSDGVEAFSDLSDTDEMVTFVYDRINESGDERTLKAWEKGKDKDFLQRRMGHSGRMMTPSEVPAFFQNEGEDLPNNWFREVTRERARNPEAVHLETRLMEATDTIICVAYNGQRYFGLSEKGFDVELTLRPSSAEEAAKLVGQALTVSRRSLKEVAGVLQTVSAVSAKLRKLLSHYQLLVLDLQDAELAVLRLEKVTVRLSARVGLEINSVGTTDER